MFHVFAFSRAQRVSISHFIGPSVSLSVSPSVDPLHFLIFGFLASPRLPLTDLLHHCPCPVLTETRLRLPCIRPCIFLEVFFGLTWRDSLLLFSFSILCWFSHLILIFGFAVSRAQFGSKDQNPEQQIKARTLLESRVWFYFLTLLLNGCSKKF